MSSRDTHLEIYRELTLEEEILVDEREDESAVHTPPDEFEDDFTALLRQKGEAREGVEGDDLKQEIQYRRMMSAEANARAPRVRTSPASLGEAVMGSELVIVGGNAPVVAAYWNGDADESTTIAVMLSRAARINAGFPTGADPNTAKPFAYRPFARVLLGTRAGIATFDVDVNRGCHFSVACSSITVLLGIDAPPSGSVAATMLLAADIALGRVRSQIPIARTSYVDSLANAGTQAIVVPAFAQALLPIQRSDLAGAVNVDFRDANATVLYSRALSAGQVMTENIPVADDVYDVLVTNNGPNTSNYRLVWGLAVG